MKWLACIILWLIVSLVTAQPVGYYNGTEGLRGDALKTKLHEIIRNHHSLSYYFSRFVIFYADADPAIPGNVILVYTGRSHDGNDYGTGSNQINREHVWAKSHGQFSGILPMDSDVHNLKPSEASVNNARGNLDFDWSLYPHPAAPECKFTPGVSWEPRDAVKGDIARIILYMDTRYEGTEGEMNLTAVDKVNTYPYPQHGKLSTLLQWNVTDQPDQFEYNRNNVIYRFQKNRNPFIDHPLFARLIWENHPLPYYKIGDVQISDPQPYENVPVLFSCTISPAPSVGEVVLLTGPAFNQLNEEIPMSLVNGRWQATIGGKPEGTVTYLSVRAGQSDKTSRSPVYSYRVAMKYDGLITSITEIQGIGDMSPYQNMQVTTTGVVTAFLRTGYFIQAGTGPRTGLFVYDPARYPSIGDSIVITGIAKEYYGLTEIASISMFRLIKTDRKVPEPKILTSADIGEDWESVLVRIENAVCTFNQHWNNSGMWRISDHLGEVNIQNNDVFSITPILNRRYTVTGVLNYSWSNWKIELRHLKDVGDPASISTIEENIPWKIFPNPTGQKVTCILPPFASERQVCIQNLYGQIVHRENLPDDQSMFEFDFSIANCLKGIYLISYSDSSHAFTHRVIFTGND